MAESVEHNIIIFAQRIHSVVIYLVTKSCGLNKKRPTIKNIEEEGAKDRTLRHDS